MRQIKFRGVDMSGNYNCYGLLSIRRRGKKNRYYIVNDMETVQVHASSVSQLIGVDELGNEIYEGDTVIRVKEWSNELSLYLDVEGETLRADFEDYAGIRDGEIVLKSGWAQKVNHGA